VNTGVETTLYLPNNKFLVLSRELASGSIEWVVAPKFAVFEPGKFREFDFALLYVTSYGGGFAALWRHPDRSSPARLPGIPHPWLPSTLNSNPYSILAVQVSSPQVYLSKSL